MSVFDTNLKLHRNSSSPKPRGLRSPSQGCHSAEEPGERGMTAHGKSLCHLSSCNSCASFQRETRTRNAFHKQIWKIPWLWQLFRGQCQFSCSITLLFITPPFYLYFHYWLKCSNFRKREWFIHKKYSYFHPLLQAVISNQAFTYSIIKITSQTYFFLLGFTLIPPRCCI